MQKQISKVVVDRTLFLTFCIFGTHLIPAVSVTFSYDEESVGVRPDKVLRVVPAHNILTVQIDARDAPEFTWIYI